MQLFVVGVGDFEAITAGRQSVESARSLGYPGLQIAQRRSLLCTLGRQVGTSTHHGQLVLES